MLTRRDLFERSALGVRFLPALPLSAHAASPELCWLATRWGKRFLSDALAVYVHEGVLTHEEALEAARMILYTEQPRRAPPERDRRGEKVMAPPAINRVQVRPALSAVSPP